MYRRNTINTKPSEYPEHLNPFHDAGMEDTDAGTVKNKLGRRNSRLTASFRLNSWNVFSSRKNKPVEADVTAASSNTSKSKFSTLSPKLSERILDALSPRSNKKHGTLTKSNRYSSDKAHTTIADFKITPRQGSKPTAPSDTDKQEIRRDKTKSIEEQPRLEEEQEHKRLEKEECEEEEKVRKPVPEPRVVLTPVPLPRSGRTVKSQQEMQHANHEVSNSPTNPTEEVKFIKQGAKPKKKRQAPLPPITPSSSQKEINSNASETNSMNSSESPSPKPAPRSRIECSPSSIEEMEDGVTTIV